MLSKKVIEVKVSNFMEVFKCVDFSALMIQLFQRRKGCCGLNLSSISAEVVPLHLRSCLIYRQEKLIFEHYRHNQVEHELAKVNSCTKSFLSALICIALDQGIFPSVDTKLHECVPMLDKETGSWRKDITIQHLLTMSGGWRWEEFGGLNSFPHMTRSQDWVSFALEQPMANQPGEVMEYNSGSSQILSHLLVQATGDSIVSFAETYLFGPLGINDFRWEQDPQGIHTGGFGLSLRPIDLLNFGRLYLQQGRWENQQLISPELTLHSVQPAIKVTAPWSGYYAWHWWCDRFEEDGKPSFEYFYSRGYGGQFIYVIPSLEAVVVLTDDRRKRDHPPTNVFSRFIAPHL